jgi:hypothetical protein
MRNQRRRTRRDEGDTQAVSRQRGHHAVALFQKVAVIDLGPRNLPVREREVSVATDGRARRDADVIRPELSFLDVGERGPPKRPDEDICDLGEWARVTERAYVLSLRRGLGREFSPRPGLVDR